jgi:hypothetical protein
MATYSERYRSMIYAAVATLYFYRDELIPVGEGKTETLGAYASRNAPVIARVVEEVKVYFGYELSSEQVGSAINAYLCSSSKLSEPLTVADALVSALTKLGDTVAAEYIRKLAADEPKVRTIAIVLCDNDFGNTFVPLLNAMNDVIKYRKGSEITPEFMEKVIRLSIMPFYVAFQHRPELLSILPHGEEMANTEKYLSKIKVLFDEEAEAHIANTDHDGGSWYLEVQSGVVSSY